MISFLTALGISELQRLIKIDYPEAHLQSLKIPREIQHAVTLSDGAKGGVVDP